MLRTKISFRCFCVESAFYTDECLTLPSKDFFHSQPYHFHPKCERCKLQYFQFLSLTAFLSSFLVLFFFFSLTVSFSFSLPFLFFTYPFFYISSFLLFALLSSFVSFRSNHLFSVILSLQFLMKQVLRSTILSSTILLVFFDNSRIGRF